MTTISVVVVSYNTEALLHECLTSLVSRKHEVEIVVVDNASHDSSAATVANEFPDATLIRNRENVGFARAVNAGVATSSGEYLLLFNPDARLVGEAIDTALEFAEGSPQCGLFGCRLEHEDGTLDPSSAWGRPTLWGYVVFALGLNTLFPRSPVFNPEGIPVWDRESPRAVGVVSGVFLLMRRSVWDRLGGLDPDYFLYGEDADLSLRAWHAGYTPTVVTTVRAIHRGGGSSGSLEKKLPLMMKGKTTLIRKHFPPIHRRLALAAVWTGVALRAAGERFANPRADARPWSAAFDQRRSWFGGYGRHSDMIGAERAGR